MQNPFETTRNKVMKAHESDGQYKKMFEFNIRAAHRNRREPESNDPLRNEQREREYFENLRFDTQNFTVTLKLHCFLAFIRKLFEDAHHSALFSSFDRVLELDKGVN